MVESIRGFRLALMSMLWAGASIAAFPHAVASAGQGPGSTPASAPADGPAKDPKAPAAETARPKDDAKKGSEAKPDTKTAKPDAKKDAAKAPEAKAKAEDGPANPKGELRTRLAEYLSSIGDEPPRPFVPKHPRTVEDRKLIDSVRLYSAARSLEDQRRWTDAAALLQEALKLDPESVAIPKRLSRLYVGPLRNPELAMQFGKKVLQVEPGDADTLGHLVDYFTQKNDSAGAEALLREVLANPKLAARGRGRLMAEFELGRLDSARPDRIKEAADHFAKVMEMLDDRSASQLSPQDQARILSNEPATAYLTFGLVFLSAKRPELAVRAFERGLVYDEDNAQIPLIFAETLLSLNKGDRALALVDRFIRRQPQGIEAYELLAKVLKLLKRDAEITTRLEEAARRDSKNVPLQYVLADRYRDIGQGDKAEEIYKKLLGSQPTPQIYRALAQSLLKRKKYDELLKVFGEANSRGGLPIVRPQLELISADPAVAGEVLDVAYRILSGKFAALPREVFDVLPFLANQGGGDRDKKLEKLLKVQRLLLDQNPTPKEFKGLFDTEQKLGKFADAAGILEQMIARHPGEKNLPVLLALTESQHRAGRNDAALVSAREAIKLAPPEADVQAQLAELLTRIGQVDEGIALLRKTVKNEPNNPEPEVTLGMILSRFGRNAEAIQLFNDLLKRHPNNEPVIRIARQSLSTVYVNQGDYAKGESELEVLLERNPDEAGINNDLGYLYAEQGKNLEKAETMIRKALHEEPENYAYLDSLGWVLFKRGKMKEALESLQKAVDRLDRPDATILEHLGDVYLKLQDVSKAKDVWRRAQQAASAATPPDKRLAEIRKKLDSLDKLSPAPKPASSKNP